MSWIYAALRTIHFDSTYNLWGKTIFPIFKFEDTLKVVNIRLTDFVTNIGFEFEHALFMKCNLRFRNFRY